MGAAFCCCCRNDSNATMRDGARFGNGGGGDDDAWMGAKTGGEKWETVQQYGQKETYEQGEDEIETMNWTQGATYGTDNSP